MNTYDVVIVGAGPAGIFCGLQLADSGFRVLILEKGRPLERRRCPAKDRGIACIKCDNCSIVCGWGGAGAFSDGKLTLSSDVGGNLPLYIGEEALQAEIKAVDDVYLDFGAPEYVYGTAADKVEDLHRKALMADMKFVAVKIRHLGTGHSMKVLQRMYDHLATSGIEIRTGVQVGKIIVEENKVRGVATTGGEEFAAKYVMVAPGRENAAWLEEEAQRLKLNLSVNPVDVGVRVEVPAAITNDITKDVYEPKLLYYSQTFDDRVRTFCMCPNGEVVQENNQGLITVNGHTDGDRKTEYSNFALLVSKTFTEPFKEPITYGRYIARLANLLGGGVIVQRLGDLLAGRRSTEQRLYRGQVEPTLKDATPGDLSLVLPYRHLTSIIEMLKALDALSPGIYSRNTLLYGVEAKFYSSRIKVSKELETEVENLFVGGDGAGITRGLMQASITGRVIGKTIKERLSG